MEARAVARYIRVAPRKMRMVGDLVRGKGVEEAINVLHFTPKRGSLPMEKVIRSAVANAMNTQAASKLDPSDFYIKELRVDQGPVMKRYNPGPMGRASVIRKPFCHISVVVSTRAGVEIAAESKEEGKTKSEAKAKTKTKTEAKAKSKPKAETKGKPKAKAKGHSKPAAKPKGK